jgi:1,4-dihydroxy-2-naphthoate octaprenyltransferase
VLSPGTLLRALRAQSLNAAAMSVLCATALVAYDGHTVHGLYFALTLIGMVAAQGAVNLVNDYFDDASGLDADPEFAKNPFPLGSRAIQSGALSKRGVLVFAALCAGLALACGVLLNVAQAGNTVLWIALGAGTLGYFYTAPPLRIAYHGAGEPLTFLLFGPVAGAGTYHVPTGDVTGAGRLVPGILALPCLLLALAIATGALPGWAALTFLSLPFALLLAGELLLAQRA